MNVTPFSHLTDAEFVTHLSTKTDPTDEDMESMTRLELHIEAVAETTDLLTRSRAMCAAMQRSNDLFGGVA